jgi:hypothetical protein
VGIIFYGTLKTFRPWKNYIPQSWLEIGKGMVNGNWNKRNSFKINIAEVFRTSNKCKLFLNFLGFLNSTGTVVPMYTVVQSTCTECVDNLSFLNLGPGGGGGGCPKICLGLDSYYFCELGAHANFRNCMITLSWRFRKKEEPV